MSPGAECTPRGDAVSRLQKSQAAAPLQPETASGAPRESGSDRPVAWPVRKCIGCGKQIPAERRSNARYCSDVCRHRTARRAYVARHKAEVDKYNAKYREKQRQRLRELNRRRWRSARMAEVRATRRCSARNRAAAARLWCVVCGAKFHTRNLHTKCCSPACVRSRRTAKEREARRDKRRRELNQTIRRIINDQ